jgi:hypothetical protein
MNRTRQIINQIAQYKRISDYQYVKNAINYKDFSRHPVEFFTPQRTSAMGG